MSEGEQEGDVDGLKGWGEGEGEAESEAEAEGESEGEGTRGTWVKKERSELG